MAFPDLQKTHALGLINGPAGEDITYYERGLGAGKAIRAVRLGDGVSDLLTSDVSGRQIDFLISRDATAGVATVCKGVDRVDVRIAPGGPVISGTVTHVSEDRPGFWIVTVTQ